MYKLTDIEVGNDEVDGSKVADNEVEKKDQKSSSLKNRLSPKKR